MEASHVGLNVAPIGGSPPIMVMKVLLSNALKVASCL